MKKKESLSIVNAYNDERFNREIDLKTNYKTSTILCVPIFEEHKSQTSAGNIPVVGK